MQTAAYNFEDQTQGLSLVTPGAESREHPRCLFMPGDLLDPARKRQNPALRRGGEEVASYCLRRTRNFVPRAVFTPLEKWFEPIGIPELAGDRMGELVTVGGTTMPDIPGGISAPQFIRAHEPMKGLQHYPGEDITLIMEVAGVKGVRELPSLRKVEWESGEYQRLQNEYFPIDGWDWPGRKEGETLPIQLRLIEDRIKAVGGLLADEMLEACDVFRQYGTAYINIQHGLLRTRKEHQWTYSYSTIAAQLLDQLEIAAFDEGSQYLAMAKAVVSEMMTHQPQSQSVNIAEIVKQVLRGVQSAEAADVMDVAKYPCQFCKQEFPSPQGKLLHEKRHCKQRPNAE